MTEPIYLTRLRKYLEIKNKNLKLTSLKYGYIQKKTTITSLAEIDLKDYNNLTILHSSDPIYLDNHGYCYDEREKKLSIVNYIDNYIIKKKPQLYAIQWFGYNIPDPNQPEIHLTKMHIYRITQKKSRPDANTGLKKDTEMSQINQNQDVVVGGENKDHVEKILQYYTDMAKDNNAIPEYKNQITEKKRFTLNSEITNLTDKIINYPGNKEILKDLFEYSILGAVANNLYDKTIEDSKSYADSRTDALILFIRINCIIFADEIRGNIQYFNWETFIRLFLDKIERKTKTYREKATGEFSVKANDRKEELCIKIMSDLIYFVKSENFTFKMGNDEVDILDDLSKVSSAVINTKEEVKVEEIEIDNKRKIMEIIKFFESNRFFITIYDVIFTFNIEKTKNIYNGWIFNDVINNYEKDDFNDTYKTKYNDDTYLRINIESKNLIFTINLDKLKIEKTDTEFKVSFKLENDKIPFLIEFKNYEDRPIIELVNSKGSDNMVLGIVYLNSKQNADLYNANYETSLGFIKRKNFIDIDNKKEITDEILIQTLTTKIPVSEKKDTKFYYLDNPLFDSTTTDLYNKSYTVQIISKPPQYIQ